MYIHWISLHWALSDNDIASADFNETALFHNVTPDPWSWFVREDTGIDEGRAWKSWRVLTASDAILSASCASMSSHNNAI